MLLKKNIHQVILQLHQLLKQLTDEEYREGCKSLSGATIGQHVRHIIELYQCLDQGYHSGVVNYEKRKRDIVIETSRQEAMNLLDEMLVKVDKPDKLLQLEALDYDESGEKIMISTNYHRELAYNLEHAIHHMALIKVGVLTLTNIRLPEEFGVAYSTVKHRRQCAQ